MKEGGGHRGKRAQDIEISGIGIYVKRTDTRVDAFIAADSVESVNQIKQAIEKTTGRELTEGEFISPNGEEPRSSGQSFGFGNWRGSKWEPKGPAKKPYFSPKAGHA